MKDVYDMGLKGCLPLFIWNVLSERKYRVRVGTSSNLYDHEMGFPHGRILSVTLLIVKTNSITSYIRNCADKSQFVDDFISVQTRASHRRRALTSFKIELMFGLIAIVLNSPKDLF